MQRAKRIVSVIVCLFALGAGKQELASNTDPPRGAWLQTHVKWENPPSSINPQLQASQSSILYFGEDHNFAMVMCVVVRGPGEYTIKHDEGLALWRGQWAADRKGIAVWYEFVPPRPRQWPESPIVGQRIEHATIRRSKDQLTFADMKFERASALDDYAHHAMLATSTAIKLPPEE